MVARATRLIGALAVAAALACSGPASHDTTRTAPARRIISLVPALTEILFAIGAGPQVIAVSSYDDDPPEVKTLPRVGALLNPDTERILSMRPDLVLVYGSQAELFNQLNRSGIPIFRYRHGGRCAFPGCDRRITQIHHSTPWEHNGRTDLDAGIPLCWGHHHLVHEGKWTVAYNPNNGTTTFTSRDGRTIQAPPVLQRGRAA